MKINIYCTLKYFDAGNIKRRNHDPLGPYVHEKRYAQESQKVKVFLERNRARGILSSPERRKIFHQAQVMANASWVYMKHQKKFE